MLYEILRYLENQVELKITWNEGHSQHSSNWMIFLDGTYDFLGDDCGGIIEEPSKLAIEYAISKINREFTHRLVINPAMDEGSKTIEFEFKTQAELNAAMNTTADMLFFLQDDLKVMPDYSNYFIEQLLVDGVWIDVEEDDLFDG